MQPDDVLSLTLRLNGGGRARRYSAFTPYSSCRSWRSVQARSVLAHHLCASRDSSLLSTLRTRDRASAVGSTESRTLQTARQSCEIRGWQERRQTAV